MRRWNPFRPGKSGRKNPIARYEAYLAEQERKLSGRLRELEGELVRLDTAESLGVSSSVADRGEFRPNHRVQRIRDRNRFLVWSAMAIISMVLLWEKWAKIRQWLGL
ncbi:hypothetical protein [Candidatus Methylacidithermus pantelleriae]|uniref:Uncharacterized protein n=1 Tax=Candidatus Methylacidithermus pantelleriae TaxID=2744239 RepID=A0A8J2FP13_9BACT|nr:hypothetical protein [Candidatus Methylacidithermus pantelleriae]CAF0696032.1 hypothetical protein MPNT_20093 [Candidatus Methylacidithermus pantelleriae]